MLNFAAEVSERELPVTIQAEDMAGVATAVQQTLSASPACQAAGLTVSVQVQSETLGKFGKR